MQFIQCGMKRMGARLRLDDGVLRDPKRVLRRRVPGQGKRAAQLMGREAQAKHGTVKVPAQARQMETVLHSLFP